MKTQSKLILATALSFVLLSANSAMASENGHDNDDSNHHALPFSGGNENDNAPSVATNKDTEHHKLKFNDGNENDSGSAVTTQTDTDHHKEVTDPFSIDYMSKK